MTTYSEDRKEDQVERLRQALDAETQRCVGLERQVDRANADFEGFVSMAAHNLREPLREIACFSQLLAEAHDGRLDSEAVEYLGHIRADAARMQSLLTDIVDYWATGTGDGESSLTDMEAVLRQALLRLEKQIAERAAIVTHDPLPAVMGDFKILTTVFQHLIRNAIQYCDASPPRVHISSKLVDQEWVFSVQDNGPGIASALQGRIFKAFKRLHGKEFPGNGLGLAFCKKAIEWYGGRLSLESTPGAGSTFCFTLPAAD